MVKAPANGKLAYCRVAAAPERVGSSLAASWKVLGNGDGGEEARKGQQAAPLGCEPYQNQYKPVNGDLNKAYEWHRGISSRNCVPRL